MPQDCEWTFPRLERAYKKIEEVAHTLGWADRPPIRIEIIGGDLLRSVIFEPWDKLDPAAGRDRILFLQDDWSLAAMIMAIAGAFGNPKVILSGLPDRFWDP